MRRSRMKTAQLVVLVCVSSVTLAEVFEREIVSTTKGSFRLTSEVGVSPLGKKSYVFKVMACGSAIIALSNIVGISNKAGRYFMIYLGRKHNTQTDILDSCFGCTPKTHKMKPVLNCTSFNPFWISWDGTASVRLGEGNTIGENLLVEYTTDRPFPVMFLLVTTLSIPTKWKFLQPDETIFSAPLRDGSSTVSVKEDVAIGTVVYEIVIKPRAQVVLETNTSQFTVNGNELLTTAMLDFERERVFILRLRTVEVDVNLTLTVLVEDVNDETPEVVLGEGVHIPEELPVGFIIGGVFSATDKDANDTLTYRLEGDDSKFLSILETGLMRIERRIDRDGPYGRRKLDKLTLHVEDEAHHDSVHSLDIIVTDINDNVPTCASGFFSKTINGTTSSDVPVINIPCTDDDDGSNGQFSLRIVPRSEHPEYQKQFRLKAFDLFADVDTLRRESSRRESSVYILTLLAIDTPKQGRVNTGTAVVVINFVHLNDYKPQWKSPVPDINHNFPSVTVPESASPGTVVNTFVADDKDPEATVAYMLASVTDGNGNNISGLFAINSQTGELTTTAKLDCDQETGGVGYYTVRVMATDDKHNISGNVKYIVKDSNDNVPVFNKSLRIISAKAFKSVAIPLLEFDVRDHDKSSSVTVELEKDDRQYFQLSKESEKWQLKFRPGIDPQKNLDIPPVITVTANDNGDPPLTSQAAVVLTDLPCHVPTPSPPTPVSVSSNQPFRRRRCTWPSTPSTSMTSTPQTDAGKPGNSVSSFGSSPVCQPSSASQQDSRTGLYLKVACAVEGLIIVMATMFVVAKKCGCFKKSSSTEKRRERKEPVGCETALYGSVKEKRKEQTSSSSPTHSHLDVINEVPDPLDGSGKGSAIDALSPGLGLMTIHKTLDAKNKFLGLRRKETVAAVQIYSDPSGVTFFDKDIASMAGSKFVDVLKAPSPQADSDTFRIVYVSKDKLLVFLKLSPLEAPEELLCHLDSQNSDFLAVAKEKFHSIITHHTELDLLEKARPLNVMSLLDRSCFNCSEYAMVALEKNKFIDMLKESQTPNTFLTSNDAILANASGFDPSKNIVYVAKESFLNLMGNREKEEESEEMLVLPRDNVMELIQSKLDPWAEQSSTVMQFVSGVDGESGAMFMTKKTFLDLVNSSKEYDNNTDGMIAIQKHKLAELLQKNSKNPKCNDTLNRFVKAVSPASGVVYMAKKMFMELSNLKEVPGNIDDVLEIEKDNLEALMASNGADPGNVETALKLHSLGFLPGTKRVFLAKSRFLKLTSTSGKGSSIVEENEMLEVSKDTMDDMSEKAGNSNIPVIAVNEKKGSVFIAKKSFLELSSCDYEGSDMIVLTKEKAAEIADPDEDNETFLQKHALAFTPTTGKVYVARSKFVNMMKEKQSRSQTCDPEGDELVSVPREQLTEMLTTTGTHRASSFIRAHAEAFNPATGAVFMARKRFLDVAGKQKAFVSGRKEDDEVITVTKEKLNKIVNETGESNRDLSKFALAFSGDTNTAFIAKSKFLKLCKPSEPKVDGGVCEDVLVSIPEESLPNEDQVSGDFKKCHKATNPTMREAKDKFLNKAGIKSTCTKVSKTAIPDEETDDQTGTSSGTDCEETSDSNIYLAKNRFLNGIKDKHAGPSMITGGKKDKVYGSQDRLEQIISAGECVQSSRETAGIYPVPNTDGKARKTFTDIARKSVNFSSFNNDESDIVAVNESQVAEILKHEGDKGNPSQLLQKHALAVNKTDGKVYFLKKKFQELSLNARKGNCESFISTSNQSVTEPVSAAKSSRSAAVEGSTDPNAVSDVAETMDVASTKERKSYWNHPMMHGISVADKEQDVRRIPCGYDDDTESDESDDSYTESSGDSQLDVDTGWPRGPIAEEGTGEYVLEAAQKPLVPPSTSVHEGFHVTEEKCEMKAKECDVRHRHHITGRKRKPKGSKGHGKASRKTKHKRKRKIAPEVDKSASEMSDQDGAAGSKKMKKKFRKGGQVHPELETPTSETEDGTVSTRRQKTKHRKHKRSKHK